MVKTMLNDRQSSRSRRTKCFQKAEHSRSSSTSLRFKRLYIARPDVLHQYLRHSDINQYLDYLKHRYPSFVKLHTLGVSYEGRALKAIEIDWNCERNIQLQAKNMRTQSMAWKSGLYRLPPGTTEDNKRNMIFIEGGTHGREWLTISVALNIIHQLTEKHIRNTATLKRFRFFIVPLTNPDGYEYSLTKNLRWRKNRRPTSPSCKNYGVDCNRNYDFHWDMGSAKETCCTYKGEKPFSESETRALSDCLQSFGPDLLLFISLHSYAQAIMYPWGHTIDPPENVKELQAIASAGSYAIRAHSGRHYRTGSIVKLSNHMIGGSIVDYAYGVIKVPYAYVMELPCTSYGFQPPAEVIRPIGQESWIAIREMCYCAQTLYTSRPPNVSLLQKMREKYGQAFALAKQMLHGDENAEKLIFINRSQSITENYA